MHQDIKQGEVMKNNISKMKNITLKTLVFAMIMTGGCYAYADTLNMADTTIKQSIELPSDIDEYIRATRRSIKDKWYPPAASFENNATIVLSIDRKGQLLNCYLSEKSPDEGFNNSLIEAAKKAVYLPLPDKIGGNSVEISLSFGMQRRHVSK